MALTNATNSYSGGTTLTGGTLDVSADGALGAVPGVPTINLTLGGGNLQAGGALVLSASRNILLATPRRRWTRKATASRSAASSAAAGA